MHCYTFKLTLYKYVQVQPTPLMVAFTVKEIKTLEQFEDLTMALSLNINVIILEAE